MRNPLVIAALGCVLASCNHIEGPAPIVRGSGPIRPAVADGLVKRFYDAADTAESHDMLFSNRNPTKDELLTYDRAQRRMLNTGFTLVYTKCSDFFYSSGKDQTRLMTFKDAVASLGTLAVGALALVDFKKDNDRNDILAVVGLGTSATMAGIDIYTQRFLFGADNVDAVRELTLRALNDQQREITRVTSFSYDDVIKNLLDVQATCTPRRIAILAGNAIKQGQVQAAIPLAPSPAEPKSLITVADQALLARVAETLNLQRALSADEELGLFWLAKGGPSQVEAGVIKDLLKDIPESGKIFKSNDDVDQGWPHLAIISALLSALHQATQEALSQRVADVRAAAPAAASAQRPIAAPAPEPLVQSTPLKAPVEEAQLPTTAPNYSGRVTVDIVPK